MFQRPYPPKSPFLTKTQSRSDQSAPALEIKTQEKELIKGNVRGMFKLSNSRVLIEENRTWAEDEERLYILDLKDSSRIHITSDTILNELDINELDFGHVEECLELRPDTLILRLRTNNHPFPYIQDCLVKLSDRHGVILSLEDSPNLELGHTTVLSDTRLASLRFSQEQKKYYLELFDYSGWPKLLGKFALNKPYHSLTALDANTLILGGRNGDVDMFQIKDNQLIPVYSFTATLRTLRASGQTSSGGDQFVRAIGKNRDILLIVEKNAYMAGSGLVSLWTWDAKSNNFTKVISINMHKLTDNPRILELEDGEHFVLHDGHDSMFLDTQLQSFHFPYATQNLTFLDFPEGCALGLMDGKVFKLQLDYRPEIKSQVDESTSLRGFGALSRYVAEYTCIGEDEEKPLQIGHRI